MKSDKFLDAMGMLDQSIIEEYEKAGKIKKVPFIRYASLAASFLVVVSAAFLVWRNMERNPMSDPSIGTDAPPVTDNTVVLDSDDFKITSIEAKKTKGSFITCDTSFIVHTENGTEENVQEHLYISTAPEYTVTKIADETFEVILDGDISDNTVVNLSCVYDGIVNFSWAFQTEGTLSLSGSYPMDGDQNVSADTVIELEFSYASAEGIEDAVSFEPEIAGSWEHSGKVWRFTPDEALAENCTYKIRIGDEISAEGEGLDKSYSVSFSTFAAQSPYKCSADIITADRINTYLPDDDITLRYIDESEGGPASVGRVEVCRFDSYTDMIAFSRGESAYSSDKYKDVYFKYEQVASGEYSVMDIRLTESLDEGYYVAHVYSTTGAQLFDWIIQVHPLSLYAAVSENDVLVWAALDGELAEDVSVSIMDEEGSTDGNGMLLFDDIFEGVDEVVYLLAGDEDFPLVAGSPDFSRENYPAAYLYTDKTKYKNNDTVSLWGIVPMELFGDGAEGSFEIMLGDEGNTLKVSPDENGTFSCRIPIANRKDGEIPIKLLYNGTAIGERKVEIANYYLKNYTFRAIYDNNIISVGENFEFDVMVTHVSGIEVPDKMVAVSVEDGGILYGRTDENGIAHFSVTPGDYSHGVTSSEIYLGTVRSFDLAMSNPEASEGYSDHGGFTVYAFTDPVAVSYSVEDDGVGVELGHADPDGCEKSLAGTPDMDSLEKIGLLTEAYDTDVTLRATIYKETRDPDSADGQKVGIHPSETEEIAVSSRSITLPSHGGKVFFDLSDLELPESSEDECYRMECTLSVPLPSGRTYSESFVYDENTFADSELPSKGEKESPPRQISNDADTEEYGYFFQGKNIFKAGDECVFKLTSADGESVEGGKLLYFLMDEDIESITVCDEDTAEFTAAEDFFPSIRLAGAYFKDGVFYGISPEELRYDAEERQLDISVDTEKSTFEPGDEVTVTVRLNSAEKALEGAAVNISVVSEGAMGGESVPNVTKALLRGKDASDYFLSTHRDYSIIPALRGEIIPSAVSRNFGDTVYFACATSDENGECTFTFTLPKDKTDTLRITVHGVNGELYSGVQTAQIKVEKDFFIQVGEISGIKTSDDLCISAMLISDIANERGKMTFTLDDSEEAITLDAVGGKTTIANLGKLEAGEHTVKVSCTSESGRSHEITVPVTVKVSTMEITEEFLVSPAESTVITPEKSPVTLKIFSEEAQLYMELIEYIENSYSDRFDTAVSGKYAAEMKKMLGESAADWENSDMSAYAVEDDMRMDSYLIAPIPGGEGDAVLSALYSYIFDENEIFTKDRPMSRMLYAEGEVELAQSLLLRAAMGEPVLVDLLYAKEHVSDDPYTRAILSLAFALCGDITGAKDVLVPVGEGDPEGSRAIYSAALTFIDREAGADEILRLFREDPDELYLDLAALLYMKTGEAMTGEGGSVTVVCGDREIPVEFGILEIKRLVLNTEEGESIGFKDISEGVLASYSYQASFEPKEDERNVKGVDISFSRDPELYNSTHLTVDLSGAVPEGTEIKGRLRIALPNCFGYDISSAGDTSAVALSGNFLTVYVDGDDDGIVQIPLIVTSTGSYVLEPAVFTCSGVHYYSDAVEISIG